MRFYAARHPIGWQNVLALRRQIEFSLIR